jgi:dinuclear metal center YbgI/SA1388 family protein
MTTVAEVAVWLEQFAPSRLAEPWDNVGLLWGDPAATVERSITCLTVTPTTAAEAIRERAELIVSHHPVLLRETRRIRADLVETGHLWSLARAGVAIASPHTAFDNTSGGINDLLCHRLGIVETAPLRPIGSGRGAAPGGQAPGTNTFKVVVFTPEADHEALMSAVFGAGAGVIGAYRECSFAIPGEGTFFGTEASDPAVGQRGRRESVAELRLEFVCPSEKLASVLAAIRAHHSYEEPAIDVYPLHDHRADRGRPETVGAGRLGRLDRPVSLADFAAVVGITLDASCVQIVGDPRRSVQSVAVCCGAGDDFLTEAARAGADVLLTGEARFHRGLEAEALGIAMITAGHHATERIGVADLAGRIAAAFPQLSVWPSRSECDPFRLVATGVAGERAPHGPAGLGEYDPRAKKTPESSPG